MKTTDIKGHLLTRRANLENAQQETMRQVLVMKENLRDLEARFAAGGGAIAEISRVIELLETPAAP